MGCAGGLLREEFFRRAREEITLSKVYSLQHNVFPKVSDVLCIPHDTSNIQPHIYLSIVLSLFPFNRREQDGFLTKVLAHDASIIPEPREYIHLCTALRNYHGKHVC
jgi:hypothetical protein